VRLNPTEFPHDDQATFELLSRGESAGVFQFESGGMVDTLKRLKPRRIQDLIAVSALYRPGPMENIPAYIRRHHGEEEVRYDDFPVAQEWLAPILEETYGIPVYQEQIMQIAQAVAGYSLGEADLLRRAMGKKKVEEMEKQRAVFERGAAERGIPPAEASGIFDLLEKFANYGFNKSHSAAYGELSFQTAYLKAHYPVEFAAALLTVERGDSDKVAEYVTDARRMGIEVLPPDINESRSDFTPVGNVVRFGLYGVKNVGDGAVQAIIKEREASGPFKDLYDFARRIDAQWINRRAFEHLIQAGAFDRFGDRATLLANVQGALQWGGAQRSQEAAGQMALFGAEEVRPPTLEPAEPLNDLEILKLEKDALGLYISAHPMASYPGLADAATCNLRSVEAVAERLLQTAAGGRIRLVLSGMLRNVTKRATRKGTMMARFDLADETGTQELVAFSRTFEQIADDLEDDRPAVVVAEASFADGSLRLVCDKLVPWQKRDGLPHVAVLSFKAADVSDEQLLELRSRMDEHAGRTPVRLDVKLHDSRASVQADGVRIDETSLEELQTACPWLQTAVTIDSQMLLKQAESAEQARRGAWRNGARSEASAPST
jgi:DNA polymerase-3 subunit alpha